ncbi:hypothetical protein HNQ50_002203 [Silvimonas terrae]|uniref:Uncharacterized protein n=1 Tax=Silvimonas terrae TaxID=300266 RepID=A0A840RGQ8_9NEIS|nr:hypothetical protein [Silvimonas terrae]MBB5191473.1 hypothetical protein [Silvimonas terrae]
MLFTLSVGKAASDLPCLFYMGAGLPEKSAAKATPISSDLSGVQLELRLLGSRHVTTASILPDWGF